MPERIAVQRLIIGEGKTRRTVMPGESVTLDSETAAMLDRRDPPVVRDPKSIRPEVEAAGTAAAAAQIARVAEPAGDSIAVSSSAGDSGNVTREQAPAGGSDNDPL